ncbi:sigma-70 family RNA polymerase sigma factor [Planctomicrobium sp. SH661]|uniref:sigma-70 family RNA polymerase sigma factor n=1 Tax=Planctomicrobium sp. SH661 TaxID=3448124 RepID=UPI003F5C1013
MDDHTESNSTDGAELSSEARYEEFLTLFSRDRERLSAYIYSLLPNQADAEDVFQRCSLLLWRKFPEYERDRSFLAWACGVGFYEVRNFLRSVQRDRLQFNSELMSQLADRRRQSLDQAAEMMPVLRGCLEALSESHRELVRVAYEQDGTLKDFAEAQNQPLQTLYNQLGRIRRLLLNCVQRQLAVE